MLHFRNKRFLREEAFRASLARAAHGAKPDDFKKIMKDLGG